MAKIMELDNVLMKFKNKKNKLLYKHFRHYVVDYRIEDNHIYVLSNIGEHCRIKNTKENVTKLNQVIVENKVQIMNRINEYDESKNEELKLISLSTMLCGILALCIWLSMFCGIIPFIVAAAIGFSFALIATSNRCFELYLKAKEVDNLKSATGYKN